MFSTERDAQFVEMIADSGAGIYAPPVPGTTTPITGAARGVTSEVPTEERASSERNG
jgi:hypothetical protein